MKRNAFSLMLAAMAMMLAGACASTEKASRPMNSSTVSNAKNDGSRDTNQLDPESKPQVEAPHAQGKDSSPSRGPRAEKKKHEEPRPSSVGNGSQDASDTSEQREARITPLDQSETPSDLDTTRRIRQAVMQDESLSFKAKNVTIVTNADRVVLEGRVNTRAEADRIKDIARSVTPHPIEDRLEISQ